MKQKTPAIMLQGTSSNAGKSVLTAAFCRMLLQDGLRVAPFKAQNMALNSFVTPDGLEIGRAQATQAQACRLEPDGRMNPVLLKPTSDKGSQVIVMGRPVDNMSVGEYIRYKPEAFARVKAAYDSLAEEHDVIVLEGAGSPAEINLKPHDIVNMAMAAHARAAVLLVGDIDRGGVFASFVGTYELLDEWERELLAGYVINRFRGDASLLDPALEYTTGRTGKPFFGVIPHIDGLGLPEEDSVTFKAGHSIHSRSAGADTADAVDIALIDLRHISNFTDLDALAAEPDVRLRVVAGPEALGRPDAIVIPGSKNTSRDLLALRESGLDQGIRRAAAAGSEVVGICAGLQMLGRRIEDPHGQESDCGAVEGLGLLPIITTFARKKTLRRGRAVHVPSGLGVFGYEIHHGRTRLAPESEAAPVTELLQKDDGDILGYAAGNVWGAYLHGVFDADEFRRWFVDRLRVRKGLAPAGRMLAPYSLEPALDRLAGVVRASVDWPAIRRVAGL